MIASVILPFLAVSALASPLFRRADGYNNPADAGGSSLGYFPNSTLGEPLNIIVSGTSDADAISELGFIDWQNSIGFAHECFFAHSGAAMQADLGDGAGKTDQLSEVRQSYGEDILSGSCLESLVGGNHFRYWQQQGTNAYFLAASIEKDVSESHDIEDDGYDAGRDAIIQAATAGSSGILANYTATVEYITGLLPTGSDGVNHGISLDGQTAVLTIHIA